MAEETFVKAFLNTLASQPIQYPDDYQQPPENSLRKVPILPVKLPPPPQRTQGGSASTSAAISVTFKSTKPSASYTITVQPTDTIAAIKAQLAAVPNAPQADAQRLLLKGKALADAKLLKEYSIKDGDTVNLMVKPGIDWDPSGSSKPLLSPQSQTMGPAAAGVKRLASSETLDAESKPSGKSRKHQRIPSVVLSPSSEDQGFGDKPADIPLMLDTAPITTAEISTYHAALAAPDFWDRLNAFLRSEFKTDADALLAFEDFLRASKGTLTASEIAKIRDHVGVSGMAGT